MFTERFIKECLEEMEVTWSITYIDNLYIGFHSEAEAQAAERAVKGFCR